jgi:hypothetical protein
MKWYKGKGLQEFVVSDIKHFDNSGRYLLVFEKADCYLIRKSIEYFTYIGKTTYCLGRITKFTPDET